MKYAKSQLRVGASATSYSLSSAGEKKDSYGYKTFIESMQAMCRRANFIRFFSHK